MLAITGILRLAASKWSSVIANPGAPRHGDDVDDGVGRATHRHRDGDRVVIGALGLDFFWSQSLPDHFDDAPAGGRAHADVVGVGGEDGGGAGKRHADHVGERGHGGRRAHRHAHAVGTGDAVLHLDPILFGDVAGAAFVPIFDSVGAGAEGSALPVAAQHRAGGNIDGRDAGAGRAEQKSGRGLVAAAHQRDAVERVRADELLRLHREEIAIEHRRRLHLDFGERDRRQLQGKAARLKHAALDVLNAGLEMGVTLVDVRPGIDDPDHRPTLVLLPRVPHLRHARTLTEGAEVVGIEPAGRTGVGFHAGLRRGRFVIAAVANSSLRGARGALVEIGKRLHYGCPPAPHASERTPFRRGGRWRDPPKGLI